MIHRYTIEQALKGGFYGTIVGVGLHLLATRFWPRYASWHHTPKYIFVWCWPIAGFTIWGEQSALQLERKIAARKAMVDINTLEGKEDQQSVAPEDRLSSFSWIPSPGEMKKYVLDNRYKVVGITWLTVTSLTLAGLWANRNMPVAQKLIHARLYAQGTALVSFIAFGLAANVPIDRTSDTDRVSEEYFRAVLEGRDVSGKDYAAVQPGHESASSSHPIQHLGAAGGDAVVAVKGG